MNSLFPLALVLSLTAGNTPADKASPASADDVQHIVFFGQKRPVLIRLHIQIGGKPFRMVWSEFIKEIFESLDADKDGFLNKEEAERAPQLQAIVNSADLFNVSTIGSGALRHMDVNPTDGKVSPEEVDAYYAQSGASPLQSLGIARSNAAGYTFVNGQAMDAEALDRSLMRRLDTNGDGKLSKEELVAARALAKLDVDDDERVNMLELGPNPYAGLNAFPGFAVANSFATSNTRSATETGPFFVPTSEQSGQRLIHKLVSRYGNAGREEMGPEAFDRLDIDKNGKLEGSDFAAFLEQPPDLEVTIQLGTPMDPDVATSRVQESGAGKMPLEVDSARIEVRGSDGGGSLARGGLKQFYAQNFKSVDADGNGYLEMKEANQSVFRSGFKAMDADGDGKLYEKEVAAFVQRIEKLQTKAMRSRVSITLTEGRGLFDLIDDNHNGVLTLRELNNMPKLLAGFDRNKDGFFSPDEIVRNYQLSIGRAQLGPNPLQPGVAVFTGVSQVPAEPANPSGPVWFRRMDRNRDGDVSPREFLGTKKDFKRLDTDADGLISAEEATKADAALRK